MPAGIGIIARLRASGSSQACARRDHRKPARVGIIAHLRA
jgi:hypothetical protein